MFFRGRLRELESYAQRGEQMQREVLQFLVDCAKETEFGREHLFNHIKSYDDYVRNVPVNDYETLKGDIDRMRHGEENILWPGLVKWYAKSSGTTNDKSKFIPVTQAGLAHIRVLRTALRSICATIPRAASSTARVLSSVAATRQTITFRTRSSATSVPF